MADIEKILKKFVLVICARFVNAFLVSLGKLAVAIEYTKHPGQVIQG